MTIIVPSAREAARNAKYFELSGMDGPNPYDAALNCIGRAIAELRQEARAIKALKNHAHNWNDDDYCSICGADGRA